jgi:hypothetical protein
MILPPGLQNCVGSNIFFSSSSCPVFYACSPVNVQLSQQSFGAIVQVVCDVFGFPFFAISAKPSIIVHSVYMLSPGSSPDSDSY